MGLWFDRKYMLMCLGKKDEGRYIIQVKFLKCYLTYQYTISSQEYLWIMTAVFHPNNCIKKGVVNFLYNPNNIY